MCFVGYWEKPLAHQFWEDLRHRPPRWLVVGMGKACKRSRRRRGTLVLEDPLLDALFPRDSCGLVRTLEDFSNYPGLDDEEDAIREVASYVNRDPRFRNEGTDDTVPWM